MEYGQENELSISKSLEISLKNAQFEMKWYNDSNIQILKLLDSFVNHDYRLPKNIRPNNYTIFITPYFQEKNFIFDGNATIEITFLNATQRIIVNKDNQLEITKITVNNTLIDKTNYNETTQTLFIYLKNDYPSGTNATLFFEYTGKLRSDMKGFYKSSYIDENGKTRLNLKKFYDYKN